MPNLPIVGGSYNTWGTELNDWLLFDHLASGDHYSRIRITGMALDPAVNSGDVVYFDNSSLTFKRALSDGSVAQKAIGIVPATDTTSVIILGTADTTAALVPNDEYYLSNLTPGSLTNVKPFTNVIRVGTAVTPNILLVNILVQEDAPDSSTNFPVRALGNDYQPDTNNPTIVNLSVDCTTSATTGTALLQIKADPTSPPTTVVATMGIVSGIAGLDEIHSTSVIIGRGNYYRADATTNSGTVTVVNWAESTLKG